jgi:hypothetical protein
MNSIKNKRFRFFWRCCKCPTREGYCIFSDANRWYIDLNTVLQIHRPRACPYAREVDADWRYWKKERVPE